MEDSFFNRRENRNKTIRLFNLLPMVKHRKLNRGQSDWRTGSEGGYSLMYKEYQIGFGVPYG